MTGVYLFLADGFEEVEALTPVDILRRGGVAVKTVSNTDNTIVTGSHYIHVQADMKFSEFVAYFEKSNEKEDSEPEDFLIFPGGMPGSTNLAGNDVLMDIMRNHYGCGYQDNNGSVAAICAAPSVVLTNLPDLEGKKMTCYDGFEPALEGAGATYVKEGVVSDGRIITSRGAGHAVAFGLEILKHIKGEEVADTIARSIMLDTEH